MYTEHFTKVKSLSVNFVNKINMNKILEVLGIVFLFLGIFLIVVHPISYATGNVVVDISSVSPTNSTADFSLGMVLFVIGIIGVVLAFSMKGNKKNNRK